MQLPIIRATNLSDFVIQVRAVMLITDGVLEAMALASRRLEDNWSCPWPWGPSPWPWRPSPWPWPRMSCPWPWPSPRKTCTWSWSFSPYVPIRYAYCKSRLLLTYLFSYVLINRRYRVPTQSVVNWVLFNCFFDVLTDIWDSAIN